jgi:hypothetical protein
MRWLETEKDMGPTVLLWGLLGWGVGIAVFFVSNWLMAVLLGLLTVATLSILLDFIASWRMPAEARCAAEHAVAAFTNSYPDYKLSSVALRAIEDDRFVYSIRYDTPNGSSKPQSRCYFAVTRGIDTNVVELDRKDWWPRGLK